MEDGEEDDDPAAGNERQRWVKGEVPYARRGDSPGRFKPNPLSEEEKSEIEAQTQRAVDWVIEKKKDALDAVERRDVGSISFVWGHADDPAKKIKGAGLAKIQRKHPEVLGRIASIIARGKAGPLYQQGGKRNIILEDATVVLALRRKGERMTWLLNAFEEQNQEEEESR